MAEWIGHVMADWPFWLIVIVLLIISIVWIFYYTSTSYDHSWNKKEWWQDREKRLEKEAKARQLKTKVKKG